MNTTTRLADVFPLPDEVKRLRVLIGEWNVEVSLTFMAKSFKVKGSASFSSAAGGWGVLVTGKLEIEDLGSYEEVDVLGFDRSEKMYHFFSVTNTAAAYDHKGKWSDEDNICFDFQSLQDGKKYSEETEVRVQTPRALVISEKDSL